MEPTITVAVIISISTVATQIIISTIGKKSTLNMIAYKIDELSKRVSAHNNLIERMYCVEKGLELQEQRLDEICWHK